MMLLELVKFEDRVDLWDYDEFEPVVIFGVIRNRIWYCKSGFM